MEICLLNSSYCCFGHVIGGLIKFQKRVWFDGCIDVQVREVSCKLSKELLEIGVRGSFQLSVVSSGVQ